MGRKGGALKPRRPDIRQQQAHIADKESERRGLGARKQLVRDAQHAAVRASLLPQEGQSLQKQAAAPKDVQGRADDADNVPGQATRPRACPAARLARAPWAPA